MYCPVFSYNKGFMSNLFAFHYASVYNHNKSIIQEEQITEVAYGSKETKRKLWHFKRDL